MKEVIDENKYVSYDEEGNVLLIIENLGDNTYMATNRFTKMTMKAIVLDDYRTKLICIEHKKADKNGVFRKSKKLLEHDMQWFSWLLQEKGLLESRNV